MREKLLFVTKGIEDYDEGISYVLELSRILDSGLIILMIYDRALTDAFEDSMAAVTFAEVGEFKTAREILEERQQRMEEDAKGKVAELAKRYKQYLVEINYQIAFGDVASNIKAIVKKKPSIELVLLSPNLSNKGIIDIKKLLKEIARPIVTMSQPAEA
jgi:hypothetical protein